MDHPSIHDVFAPEQSNKCKHKSDTLVGVGLTRKIRLLNCFYTSNRNPAGLDTLTGAYPSATTGGRRNEFHRVKATEGPKLQNIKERETISPRSNAVPANSVSVVFVAWTSNGGEF